MDVSAVMGIFALSTGVETPMKDGEVLSAGGSRWVELVYVCLHSAV